MQIYHNIIQEEDTSGSFIKSRREKIAQDLVPLANINRNKPTRTNKYKLDEMILDKRDLNRINLLLNNKYVIITKDNFSFYEKISKKLRFSDFSHFLRKTNFNELETPCDFLSALESFLKTIVDDTIFSTAIKIFPSIITEVDIHIFLNLIYNLCYASSKKELIIRIFEFIQKVSLTFPFMKIFNSNQEKILLEHKQCCESSIQSEFNFLSYCAYITLNQQVMTVMNETRIGCNLYRDNLDIFQYFNKDTLFPKDNGIVTVIYDDDIDTLKRIIYSSNLNEKYLTNTLKLPYKMHLIDIAAYFGSLICFKHLFLNDFIKPDNLPFFSIIGQNCEIIKICDDNKFFNDFPINQSSLEASLIIHNNELFEWLTENKNLFDPSHYQKLFVRSIKTSNYEIMKYIYEYCRDNQKLEVVFNDDSLSEICEMSNTNLFEWYIEKVPQLTEKQLQICFCSASKSENIDFLNTLLNFGITKYDDYGNVSPLHYLTKTGDLEIIEKTLNMNRKVLNLACEIEINMNLTPLMVAFKFRHYEVARFLLSQRDIDINATGSIEGVLLSMDVYHYVCYLEDDEAFSMLMDEEILSKLKKESKCTMYKPNKDIEIVLTHKDMVKNAKNRMIRRRKNSFQNDKNRKEKSFKIYS